MSEAIYKVVEILGQNEWAPPDDPTKRTIYWSFRAGGVDKVCEIGRKPGNDLQVGEEILATAREDRGKLKLKRVAQQNGGFQGGGKREFREDPDRQHRIVRQHSQGVGVALVEMAIGSGIVPKPEDSGALFELLRKTFDWLDRDVETAVANHQLSVDDAQRRSEESW